MEHQNFERELKYLKTQEGMSLEDVLQVFYKHGYILIETREKKKNESYYDDNEFSFLKKGDVIRSSKHFNADGTYFHFMYKKNVSNPEKPYVSKYELGSGAYQTIREFTLAMNIQEEILTEPFLYADMTRETAIIEKNNERLLISYDNVRYHKSDIDAGIYEKMLEVEDWTNPNTLDNANSKFDAHLCEANEILLSSPGLPIFLTKHSKPYRGYLLLN